MEAIVEAAQQVKTFPFFLLGLGERGDLLFS